MIESKNIGSPFRKHLGTNHGEFGFDRRGKNMIQLVSWVTRMFKDEKSCSTRKVHVISISP